MLMLIDKINNGFFDDVVYGANLITQCNAIISDTQNICQAINDLVAQGIYNTNFPVNRANYNDWFKQTLKNMKIAFANLELALELRDIKTLINQDSVKTKLTEIDDVIISMSSKLKESENILNKTRDIASKTVVNESIEIFSTLSNEHKTASRNWIIGMGISLLPVITGLVWLLFFKWNIWIR